MKLASTQSIQVSLVQGLTAPARPRRQVSAASLLNPLWNRSCSCYSCSCSRALPRPRSKAHLHPAYRRCPRALSTAVTAVSQPGCQPAIRHCSSPSAPDTVVHRCNLQLSIVVERLAVARSCAARRPSAVLPAQLRLLVHANRQGRWGGAARPPPRHSIPGTPISVLQRYRSACLTWTAACCVVSRLPG